MEVTTESKTKPNKVPNIDIFHINFDSTQPIKVLSDGPQVPK